MIAQRLNARRLRALILSAIAVVLLFGGNALDALANEDVPFEELGGDECFMFSLLVPQRMEGNHSVALPLELVINNEDQYRALFDPKLIRQKCTQSDISKAITKVDFTAKTVLGLWSSGACSDAGFQRRVLRDDINKTIIYSVITVTGSKPACMGPGPDSLNLIAIPKIPDGYKVAFEGVN
jgi:hypothetical protein